MPERGEKSGKDFVFDSMPKDYNKPIAKWTKTAGIIKHITHHCGQHTFATILQTLSVGIHTVSKLLGHASLQHIVNRQKDAIQSYSNYKDIGKGSATEVHP